MSPKGRVVPVKIHDRVIPDKAVAESGNFITLYLLFIMITWTLFCLLGYDPFKSLFSVVSIQGNNGLDLGMLNNELNPILKIISMFNMWIGRLEIYPVLITLRTAFEIFKR